MPPLSLADLINWGWLRIGPPYIYININPIIFQLGPLAVRWYGLMYVVALLAGLQVISGYLARKGISQEVLYRTLWWCIAAGLLGGRLYFVIQQHDLVQDYLQQPWRILATWEGGMAFYGALFFLVAMLYWRARIEHINPLVFIDAGMLFASAGQIFGRIGNLINGDIIGYKSTLPWSTVYVNPNSWACNPYVQLPTCNTPVQPAAGYELLSNIVLLAVMLYLARRLTRPGILALVYLFSYSIIQFLLFFVRDNSIETPFGLNWGLKQAQWTSLVLFIVLLPITYWILRTSKPVPAGETAATYGIPQPLRKKDQQESVTGNEVTAEKDKETLHPEQDPIIGSEITEASLTPNSDPIIGSEITEASLTPNSDPIIGSEITEAFPTDDQDTIANLDNTEVSLNPEPDTITEFEAPELSLNPEPDTSAKSEAPEASHNPDPDTSAASETPEASLNPDPDPDTINASEAPEVVHNPEPDTSAKSEAPEVSLNPEPDTSAESETPEASLNPDPDPDTINASEAPEVVHNPEPDTSAESEAPEASLNPEPDTLTPKFGPN